MEHKIIKKVSKIYKNKYKRINIYKELKKQQKMMNNKNKKNKLISNNNSKIKQQKLNKKLKNNYDLYIHKLF